jgi:hypothetical protein
MSLDVIKFVLSIVIYKLSHIKWGWGKKYKKTVGASVVDFSQKKIIS